MKISTINVLATLLILTQVACKINDPGKDVKESNMVEESTERNLRETYQLKLWWEKGIEWQQSSKEKRWCAECEHSDCKKDDNVVIKECDDGKRDQRWIFSSRKIRSYVSDDLCITARSGLDGYVSLRTCSSDRDRYQEFDLSDNIFRKSQINPRGDDDLCLTQDHHPREGERLKFVDCYVAEKNDKGVHDDTSRWVIGKWDGH